MQLKRLAVFVGSSVLALGAILFAAPAASAHVDLNTITPGVGEIVPVTPSEITLGLSGPPGNIDVEIFTRDGKPVPLTGDGETIEGNTVTVRTPALDVGTYVLIWKSIGPDGHPAVGQSYFSVGTPSGPVGDFVSEQDVSDPIWLIALRWSVYLSVALLFGVAWLQLTKLVGSERRLRFLARLAGGTLLGASAALLLATALRVGGGNLLIGLEMMLLRIPTGPAWLLLLSAGVLGLLTRKWYLSLTSSIAGSLGIIGVGHLGVSPSWYFLVPLAAAHLIAASIWLGPIAAHLVAGKTSKEDHFAFARKFTYWATGAVVLIGVSGVSLLYVRSGPEAIAQLLSFQYGETLSLKLGFIVLLILPLGIYHASRVLSDAAEKYQDRIARSGRASGEQNKETQPEHRGDSPPPEGTPREEYTAKTRKLNRLTLMLEGGGLALVVAFGSALAGLPPVPTASSAVAAQVDLLKMPETYEECTTQGEGGDQLLCLSNYFIGLSDREGFSVAIQDIAEKWRMQDEWLLRNCHAIGHKLGRHAYQVIGDITEAFSQGSDPCDYGYLHGVIEGASANFSDEELQAAMTTMCEPIGDATNHSYRQCIHGLGHAAARRVNNDLPRAMEYCRAYWREGTDPLGEAALEDIPFNLCVTGVSMEWNTQPKALDAMKLPIGHPDTLMGLCVTLDSIFQPGCVEYGTSSMGGIYEREVAAREWCDKNLEEPMACYMSIGRDVIWSPTISYEQAVEICTGGRPGEYARECLRRAMGSVATIALDADAIDEFCPYVPEKDRDMCEEVKSSMRVQIEQTVRGFIIPEEGNKPEGSSAE